ncbi:MAG: CRTAC1 family protein, partial [Bryobacteraceae bacterium]
VVIAYDENGRAVSAMGSDVKDIDNDGWPDVFYNDLMGQIWGLFRNRGGKSFQYVSPAWKIARLSAPFSGWGGGLVDYNNDGWKDLYSANGDVDNLKAESAQHDTLFENREGKEFIDVSSEIGADFLRIGYQRGSAFVDLNNDGFEDIVVTSLHEKPRILMNGGNKGSHWLTIATTGSGSNRDGIGARLKLTTASGRTLYNYVTSSGGFLSSNDPRVHFGLGIESAIRSIEIRWPSGKIQTMSDVKSDRILQVNEPR